MLNCTDKYGFSPVCAFSSVSWENILNCTHHMNLVIHQYVFAYEILSLSSVKCGTIYFTWIWFYFSMCLHVSSWKEFHKRHVHTLHMNMVSPQYVFTYAVKHENDDPHCWHECGFFPVFFVFCAYTKPHTSHQYGLSQVYVDIWLLKCDFSEYAEPHTSYEYDFSPVCLHVPLQNWVFSICWSTKLHMNIVSDKYEFTYEVLSVSSLKMLNYISDRNMALSQYVSAYDI